MLNVENVLWGKITLFVTYRVKVILDNTLYGEIFKFFNQTCNSSDSSLITCLFPLNIKSEPYSF